MVFVPELELKMELAVVLIEVSALLLADH